MAHKKNRVFLVLVTLVIVAITLGFIYLYLREKGVFIKEEIIPTFLKEEEFIKVKLYFSSPNASYLIPEEREVKKTDNINEQVKIILNELIKGPYGKLIPTLPSECAIKEVFFHKDVIFVNFNQDIVDKHCKGTTGEILSIYSIVNTLLDNFNDYRKVQILIEGKEMETLAGHIFLKRPFLKNMKLIKKSMEEFKEGEKLNLEE